MENELPKLTKEEREALLNTPMAYAVKRYGVATTMREFNEVLRYHLIPAWVDELNRYWNQEIERRVVEEVNRVGKIRVVAELPEEVLQALRTIIRASVQEQQPAVAPPHSDDPSTPHP